jgi:putative endonuclease
MPAKAGIQNVGGSISTFRQRRFRVRQYYVYILASARNGTLYIGVTNDLARRTHEHRSGLIQGFTRRYGVHLLVWYEVHGDINEAILREKRMKTWNRSWKLWLIEDSNPGWVDLFDQIKS